MSEDLPQNQKKLRDRRRSITGEIYARLVKAYLKQEVPTKESLVEATGVATTVAKRAMRIGWPELGLPPLSMATQQLANIEEVNRLMSKMVVDKQEIVKTLFDGISKSVPAPGPDDVNAVAEEASRRAAESAMAARRQMASAGKAAQAVEALADAFLAKIEKGEWEIPEKIRPEHVFLLSKAADTIAGAVHKATQTERLRAGQPEQIVGAHITSLIVGATPEELRFIAEHGTLPPRLMGVSGQITSLPVIDVDATVPSENADDALEALPDEK